jgi:RNA polymerase sigma factor (sigma-70 family)
MGRNSHELEDTIKEHSTWACRVALRAFPSNYPWRGELESAALEALWRQAQEWLATGKSYDLRYFATNPVKFAAINMHRKLSRNPRREGHKNACAVCDGSGETRQRSDCEACHGTGTRLSNIYITSLDGQSEDRASVAESLPAPPEDEERAEAWAALSQVPDKRSQEVLTWSLAGWELRKIGEAYGVSESRVSQILKQARSELATALSAAAD